MRWRRIFQRLNRHFGSPARAYDVLVLLGPVVVVAIAVLGRGLLADGLAVGYLGTFFVEVLFEAY